MFFVLLSLINRSKEKKRWKGPRNRRLTPSPIVFSFDPGPAFERHPLLYESQTNNTQRPPLPVKQSKNINSDSRI